MLGEREYIVNLLMLEIGKNRADAQTEFDRTIAYIQDTIQVYADDNKFGDYVQSAPGFVSTNEYQPLGITLCVSPFNYPLNETFTTMIPALLTGNPIILKPAKHGVLFWKYLQDHMNNSFPEGVANIITGDGPTIISPLMQSGKIDVLAFIWSEGAANAIASNHPNQNRLEQVLWLWAKNPCIVTNTADLAKVLQDNPKASLAYNGQRCTAHKIFFVHEDIYDLFVSGFVDKVEQLKIGMPDGPYVRVGDKHMIADGNWADITPMPEFNKIQYMQDLIEDARRKWARIANKYGWEAYEALMIPAVLTGVTNEMEIYWKEQFGPIVPIVKYKDVSEVTAFMEKSDYAQQAALYGDKNSGEMLILRQAATSTYGRTNINSPCQRWPDVFLFAGRKNSGMKALSVEQALKVFTCISSEVEKS